MGGDTEPESVQYWLNDEDTEMVQATLQTVQAEIQRAQTSIQHWNAIGDMRVKEIQVALSEADGYAKEVQARLSYAKAYSEAAIARRAEGEGRIAQLNATVSVAGQELQRAQVAIAEINTLIASYKMELDGVPMYLQEAASYISQAQGYIGETKVRMERDSQKYQWYQSQQVKLQQDYDKGIQMLIGQHMPAQPAKGEQ
jgi:chromosome segregation ATPase